MTAGTARASFLTPGVLFSTLNVNLKCRCMTLWERYGSDFIFEDGEWKYLHEQVCPDLGGSFDDGNQAHSKYEQLVNPQAGPGGPPPGRCGGKANAGSAGIRHRPVASGRRPAA